MVENLIEDRNRQEYINNVFDTHPTQRELALYTSTKLLDSS